MLALSREFKAMFGDVDSVFPILFATGSLMKIVCQVFDSISPKPEQFSIIKSVRGGRKPAKTLQDFKKVNPKDAISKHLTVKQAQTLIEANNLI